MSNDARSSKGPDKKLGETGPNTGGCLGTRFDRGRKKKFCEALIANCGSRAKAAQVVGVHKITVGKHYRDDPEFRENYDNAMELYRHLLVEEAFRRGVKGVKKPIFFQGRRAVDVDETGQEIPAFITEYDTSLLSQLLKRFIPEFKDKSIVENVNTNVDMGLKDLETLSPEQRKKLLEMIELEEGGGE